MFLFVCVLFAAADFFLHRKRRRRSEDLIRRTEEGDRTALEELIRLDLKRCDGVVIVAKDNRHYEYVAAADAHGARHVTRYRATSFPNARFLDSYLRELSKVDADPARLKKVIGAVEYCRSSQVYS